MQGPVVLPEDIQIVPLSDLPETVRAQFAGEDGDFALTRPRSRTPSKIIDANAAALLQQFRGPKSIVDAILAYSKEVKASPSQVLEDAYPLIESCLLSGLLVEPGAQSDKIEPSFAPGDCIHDNTVERSIQALIDCEVYQVRMPNGRLAALKIATQPAIPAVKKLLAHEADIVSRIGGAPAPELLRMDELEDGRPYLMTEWFDAMDAQSFVQRLKELYGVGANGPIAETCANIVDAYAALHDRQVIHADVHPRNVLVSEDGQVRIIDFGISRKADTESCASPRAGVAFFFEPEYAEAVREGLRHPAPNLLGEQYSVAALVYSLLCGAYYLDFSFDKEELLHQIANDQPLTFKAREASQPEALEEVVMRALQKNPYRRFASMREFAFAFRHAIGARTAAKPVNRIDSDDRGEVETAKLLDRVLGIIGDPTRALKYNGPASPIASVTYGYSGIAYAAYRIACAQDDGRLLALADAWAERAGVQESDDSFYSAGIQITPETVGQVSPYHTASGVAAVQALVASARGDRLSLDAAVNRYLEHSSKECTNPDLTLGHGSVLLGLILLLEANAPSKPPALIDKGHELCARLEDVLVLEPAIGKQGSVSYLGMAHGWAGILYVLLRWAQFTDIQPVSAVEERLRQLARLAQFTRRGAKWPVQAGPGSISLAGWCNGSAGYVHLWTLARRIYGDGEYLELAEKSGRDAFEGSGGGHGLCCGFAGQAYAQLNLYKHTGDRIWLDQARTLVKKAAMFGNGIASRAEEGLPHSLYKGDVGVAILVAEMERPEQAAMPFFEAVHF
jgi:eukaryotic-like serine/threonine-protein kinase